MSSKSIRRGAQALAALSLLGAGNALAQNAATLGLLEGYGNFETAGAVLGISGDVDRDASATLEWRRSGDAQFRPAQPLVRLDATHLAGSLFGLSPGTNYELRVTLSDPDGVSGSATATAAVATRADSLVEPNLRQLYVSAANGNDGRDGLSPQTSVKTIQRGATLAQAGDVVNIEAGSYAESVDVPRSGTAVQPIVFRGGGGRVIVTGAEYLYQSNSWSPSQGVHRRADSGTTLVVELDGGSYRRLFRYDSLAELQALAAGAPGGFFADGSFLYLKMADGSAPNQRSFAIARRDNGFLLDGRSHVRIENLEIAFFGLSEYGKGIYLRQSSDIVVRNNRIYNIGSAGVWIKGGSRNRIEDNVFTDTSIPGWPWDQTKGSTAENNGVVFTDDIGRGNIVRRNGFDGWFNGIGPCGGSAPPAGVTNETDVYRNRFRRHNDDALEPEGYCANVRLFENTVRDSHMAFAVAPAAPGPTWIVRNVGYDIGNTRTSQSDGYASSALKINSGYPEAVGPLLLYHNTLVTTAPNTDAVYLLNPGNSTFIRARNNIFAATRDVLNKVNPVVLDWNYDTLYTAAPGRLVRWMGTTYTTLPAWTAATQQEADAIVGAPNLVAAASGDYRLGPGSAAIDRGVALPGINDGYAGIAPDNGAVESDADRIFSDRFNFPNGPPPLP